MRDRARHVFGYAVLASLLLHALIFYVLPAAREFAALVPPEPEPLIARVEQLEPPPAGKPAPIARPATVAKPEVREPVPPAPVRVPKPAPVLPKPEPVPPAPPSVAEPAAQSATEPVPPPTASVAPVPPLPAPAPSPALDSRVRSDYARRISEEADRRKIYPRVAIDNNWHGEVALVMVIESDGRIASLRVTRSSGHRVLDEQALEMFRRAKREVRMPVALRGRAFELELRAVFRLDG